MIATPSSADADFLPILGSRSADRWCGRLTWRFVGLGALLRLAAYLLDFPLWWDEAFVAVNLLKRDYGGLLRPLDYGQICPVLFLWAELLSVRLFGFSEWSLRLFPLLCSLASLFGFRYLSGLILAGRSRVLAVAVFAVALHPIRHAADAKPYAADLLVALVLQTLAVAWIQHRKQTRLLWGLVFYVPVALLSSHPAAFVVGGLGIGLVWPAWRTRSKNVRWAILAYGIVAVVSYAMIYAGFTRPQAASASPGMSSMWIHSFPPRDSIVGLGRWLVVAHTGDMLAYPCGGEHGGSTLSLLACVIGAVALWRNRQQLVLFCLVGPLGLALVAAGLRLYPYGGPAPHGSAARIMQYAAPALCLLVGLGVARGLEQVSSSRLRDWLFRLACGALVIVGLVPLVGHLQRPYRAYQAEAARNFARRFWPEIGQGAEVACLRWDYAVADWDSIQLGIAVSLCNQAIESPSRRRGGPNLKNVSRTRPLRCVLSVAPETDSPRVTKWLETMRSTYELQRRDRTTIDLAQPGRPPELERYEVFEFVPKAPVKAGPSR